MTNVTEMQDMIGRTAIDNEGNKIGKVGQVYLNDQTGEPLWVTVSTGMFGTRQSFAPIQGSRWDGDNLVLAVSKTLIKDAPSVEPDGHLDEPENDTLLAHYAGVLGSAPKPSDDTFDRRFDAKRSDDKFGDDDRFARSQTELSDAGNRTDSRTDNAMIRSEERLHVGTEKVESGRVQLRKYVVTEDVTTTVPVSHEEIRLEREPVTEANMADAMASEDIGEAEHEVVLHAERPVVGKETVPVERVRLATETVTEDHEITEEVRKEQIDQPETQRPAR